MWEILIIANNFSNSNIIIVGDFNTHAWFGSMFSGRLESIL